jgi:hypothetical protein
MNIKEINPGTNGTIGFFMAFAVPLTALTVWIIIAFQSTYLLPGKSFLRRLAWPALLLHKWAYQKFGRGEKAKRIADRSMRDDFGEDDLKRNDSWV